MSTIVPRLRRSVKDRLLRHLRLCRDPGLKTRYLVVVNLLAGRCPQQTAAVLISYPRHTQERILIDPVCYEGPGTAGVLPPKPLGRMARKLQEIAALPVERRPVDLYAALAEVAR